MAVTVFRTGIKKPQFVKELERNIQVIVVVVVVMAVAVLVIVMVGLHVNEFFI
jgi:hypothetical protein